MKFLILILTIFCYLNFIDCLKCIDNIHGSTKNSDCNVDDKFCFEINWKIKQGDVQKDGTFQGCSNELSAYGASCAKNGTTPYSGNGYRGIRQPIVNLTFSAFYDKKPLFTETEKPAAAKLMEKSYPLINKEYVLFCRGMNPDLRQAAQISRSGLQYLIDEFKDDQNNYEKVKPILNAPAVKYLEKMIQDFTGIPPDHTEDMEMDLTQIPPSHFWWFFIDEDDDDK